MRPTPDEPSAHRITPAELGLLTQVVRDISRARRLSSDDAADFAQTVHVKLLERKYKTSFHVFAATVPCGPI